MSNAFGGGGGGGGFGAFAQGAFNAQGASTPPRGNNPFGGDQQQQQGFGSTQASNPFLTPITKVPGITGAASFPSPSPFGGAPAGAPSNNAAPGGGFGGFGGAAAAQNNDKVRLK